jgi:uncharacterized integral membrane protein
MPLFKVLCVKISVYRAKWFLFLGTPLISSASFIYILLIFILKEQEKITVNYTSKTLEIAILNQE